MTSPPPMDREGLIAHLGGLTAAQRAWMAGNAGAIDSLRRLALAVERSEIASRNPDLVHAARAVIDAGEPEISPRAAVLIAAVARAAHEPSGHPVVILLVDDDPDLTDLLRIRLAAPHREVLVAHTAADGERLLMERDVSLVILDLLLPDEDGRELLTRLRAHPSRAWLPVIVLSGHGGSPSAAECYSLGADACFEKPFDPDILSAAVAGRLQRISQLLQQSRGDPLTGLANRLTFRESFEQATALARRTRLPLSLAMLDLDRFKSVNDLHGHAVGDQVLRRTAAVLTTTLRRSDVVARWGGEEFIVLFQNTGEQEASLALRKALEALGRERFPTGTGETFAVSFSAGVAESTPTDGLDEILERADRLLYLAKASGRSAVLCGRDPVRIPPQRILLAEDDPDTANLLERSLGADGIECVRTTNGREAIALIESSRFSLAILDVMMPEADGYEVLRRLRRIPACASLPVIMLTSLEREEEIVRGFSLGASDYVVKPFGPAELLSRVRRLLPKSLPAS